MLGLVETVFPKQTFIKYYTSPLGGYKYVRWWLYISFLVGTDHYYYWYLLRKKIASSIGGASPSPKYAGMHSVYVGNFSIDRETRRDVVVVLLFILVVRAEAGTDTSRRFSPLLFRH